MTPEEIMKKLQEPFDYEEIEWMVKVANEEKKQGLALPYVTARAIYNRLDKVCGINGWKNEYKEWKDKSQLCGISIKINDEWITKWDGADDSNTDGTKGGLSGSCKRAASVWGIGRYLYRLPNIWTEIEIKPARNGKKTYIIKRKPTLPDWALPQNSTKINEEITWDANSIPDIPQNVQACLDAFKSIGVKQTDIEEYLHKEAFMISDDEIIQLRQIYLKIHNKKASKEDYFYEHTEQIPPNIALETKLEGAKV